MKRKIGILAGIAALGICLYVGKVWAQNYQQQQRTYAAPLKTRIALINLGQVIKNYKKFQSYEQYLKEQQKGYQDQLEKLKNQATALQAEAARPETTATRKEQIEKDLKGLQFQAQELKDEGQKKLSKLEYDSLLSTYKDVETAVSSYARSRDIELVMHYNDGIKDDKYLPGIFKMKLANGACWPMYVAPGMDITEDIYNMLNQGLAGSNRPGRGANGN